MRHKKKSKIILKKDRRFIGKNRKKPKYKYEGRKKLDKLVLVDGNSIMNRAFYGIMGSKMLTTKDGKYTNAVYGFLAILFKLLEDINPQYLVVAFDLKAPTARHKLYEGYKANRKGMPDELAEQMPIIKEILKAMNIDIVEMEGYEADDVLRNFILLWRKARTRSNHFIGR